MCPMSPPCTLVPCPIDCTLPELVERFSIPDVPDVATVHPDQYQRNLDLLDEVESLGLITGTPVCVL